MWIWIIIGGCILGAILGAISSDNNAAEGAIAGGCMAADCLLRLLVAALSIFFVIWIFNLIFS